MKLLLQLLYIALVCMCSCAQSTKKSKNKELSETALNISKTIVFGSFCGECEKHCATMIQYVEKNKELRMDFTDSYFKRRESGFVFDSVITDNSKIFLAQEVLKRVSGTLTEGTYGCPDCADGCGIFIQLTEGVKNKIFYIDTDTSQIKNSEVKILTVYIMSTIEELKK